MGHLQVQMLQNMKNIHYRLSNLKHVCQIYPTAKQARRPFENISTQTSSRIDLLHLDVWGPFTQSNYNNCRYFTTIVDDFSSMCWA